MFPMGLCPYTIWRVCPCRLPHLWTSKGTIIPPCTRLTGFDVFISFYCIARWACRHPSLGPRLGAGSLPCSTRSLRLSLGPVPVDPAAYDSLPAEFIMNGRITSTQHSRRWEPCLVPRPSSSGVFFVYSFDVIMRPRFSFFFQTPPWGGGGTQNPSVERRFCRL